MESKKINQLATNVAPLSTDLTIIGDPSTGVSKKVTLSQIAAIFAGAVDFYANLAAFPASGTLNTIYCAKDTQKLYLWSGSAYVETFPSQAVLNTYQLLSAKGVANGYASLDSAGKVPIAQLPSSIMEYKGLWSAATNTPTLANGTGDTGDVYICSAAGSVNFGAGAITFAIGDYVIYSGSIWQRSSGAVGTVTSVGLSSATSGVTIGSSPITTSGTITLAIATATTSQNGLLSSTDWATFNGKESVLTFSSPLVRTTNTISIPAATTSVNGYLASADFTTFNNKQNAITLTTTGTSGASTLVGATLNIPNYGSALTGYVPYTGATQDVDLGAFKLNAQSLHIKGTAGNGHLGLKHQSASATASANEVSLFADSLGDLSWLNGNLYLSKFITSGNTAARSYTFPNATGTVALVGGAGVGTVTSVAALTIGTTGTDLSSTVATGTTTPVITLNVPTASATNRGALSSADWTTFNNKQAALTNPVTGTGTTNYLSKFTGASTIGESIIYNSGSVVAIGTTTIGFNAYGLPLVVGSGTGNQGITIFSGSNSYGSLHFAYGTTGGQSYNGGIEYSHSTNELNILASTGVSAVFKYNQVIIPYNGSHSAGSESFYVQENAKINGQLSLGSTLTNGTYTYTLPSATGTLALTSALSAYLPLAGGTLTGNLNGTTATFSDVVTDKATNISADGAGVVLQGYVDNNLRIAVRGSGYNSGARGGLYASTGDFNSTLSVTGALSGTSATFTSGTTGPSTGITSIGDITAARTSTTGVIFLGSSGSKYLYYDGTKYLLNASPLEVGGSVTATQGNFFQTAASGFALNMKNRNATQQWGFVIDTDAVDDKIFGLYSTQASIYALKIASTGAATFSSTVDASRFNGNLLVGSATVGGSVKFNYGANAASRSYIIISDAYNFGDLGFQQSTTQTGSTYANKMILAANGDLTIGSVPSTGVGNLFAGAATFSSTIKTGTTSYGAGAIKLGIRNAGTAVGLGGYMAIEIDGTTYFINLFTTTP